MKVKISADVRARDPVHHDYVPLPLRRLVRKSISSHFAGFAYAREAALQIESFDPRLDGLLQGALQRKEGAEADLWAASNFLGANLMTVVTLVLASALSKCADVRFVYDRAAEKASAQGTDVQTIAQCLLGKRIPAGVLLARMGVVKKSDDTLVRLPLPDDLFVDLLQEAMISPPSPLMLGSYHWPDHTMRSAMAEHILIELRRTHGIGLMVKHPKG